MDTIPGQMITDALEHRSAGGADGGLALAVLDAGGGNELSGLEGEHHFSPSQTVLLVRAQALSVGRRCGGRCVLFGGRVD